MRLIAALALLSAATFGFCGSVRGAETGFEVIDTAVISRHPHYFHGWPTMLWHDGLLRVVYSGGREDHVCPFGRVEMIVSRDGGTTWAWPQVLQDSAIDDRDTSLVVTKSGTLLVGYYGSLAYQGHLHAPERRLAKVFGPQLEEHLARWRNAELVTTADEKEKLRGPRMIRSTDGGLTWSAPYVVPCFTPHGPTSLADGTLFYAGADGKKAGAWISNDDGRSWQLRAEIPVRAGEMHAIEADDGTIVLQVRDKVPATSGVAAATVTGTLQTESTDGGRTWTTPRPIVPGGYPSQLLRLRSGALLMTYGVRVKPYGVRARLSDDRGRSWKAEMMLADDGANDNLGYPTTAELQDGTLVTVWYEVTRDSKLAVLRQMRWKVR